MTQNDANIYVITANIDSIANILVSDFSVKIEEAKFMTYVLLSNTELESKENYCIDKKDLDAWYLKEEHQYTGMTFANNRYTITFTKAKMAVLNQVFFFLGTLLGAFKGDLWMISAEILFVLCNSITKIKDEDYCVFARIIELNKVKATKVIDINEIKPFDKNNYCNYRSEEWNCPHLHEEHCCNDLGSIKRSLENLEKENILRKMGSYWMLEA